MSFHDSLTFYFPVYITQEHLEKKFSCREEILLQVLQMLALHGLVAREENDHFICIMCKRHTLKLLCNLLIARFVDSIKLYSYCKFFVAKVERAELQREPRTGNFFLKKYT